LRPLHLEHDAAIINGGRTMSSTTGTRGPAIAARRGQALLYPTLLIAGIAVIIASMLGIAAMTGLLPRAQSQAVEEQSPAVKGTSQGKDEGNAAVRANPAQAKTAQAKPAGKSAPAAIAAGSCTDCGIVDSIHEIEAKGQGSGIGAVAGGVVGGILGNQVGGGSGRTAMTVAGAGAGAYAGHELEKNMKKNVSYEIRVRMDDDSYRTFHVSRPGVGVGQRISVRDGQLVRAD
jgi:outer membrane lipoprotein SlyB